MPDSVALLVGYVLTALAGLAVVLTRLRLRADDAAGRLHVGRRFVDVHTVCGTLALVAWLVLLVGGDRLDDQTAGLVGIVALAFFWITALAGLALLMRWLPSKGRHASAGRSDRWSQGPWLSVLAHVGMVLGVGFFTYLYSAGIV